MATSDKTKPPVKKGGHTARPGRIRSANPKSLTLKQARFVAEYLVDLNGTQAAIRAGYSPRTAQEQASRLLSKVIIRRAVAAGQTKQIDVVESRAERVIGEAVRIAHSDLRRACDVDGHLLPLHEIPDDLAPAIASVEVLERRVPGTEIVEHVRKIRAWDKNAALVLLAKHHRLLTDKVEHSGAMTIRAEQESDWTKYLSDEELDKCNAAYAETKPIIDAAQARWAAARAARQRGNS